MLAQVARDDGDCDGADDEYHDLLKFLLNDVFASFC